MRYLIGIGNWGARDDSIGLRVAEAIADQGLDRGFAAIELPGNLIDLLHYLGPESEQVLIVDSARMGLAPGAFAFFTPAQVTTRKRLEGVSTHEGDLLKVLELGTALGIASDSVVIMGVEPATTREGTGLSGALESRLAEYVGEAIRHFVPRS